MPGLLARPLHAVARSASRTGRGRARRAGGTRPPRKTASVCRSPACGPRRRRAGARLSVTPGQKHLAVYSIARASREPCPKAVPSASRGLAAERRPSKTIGTMAASRLEFRILGPLTVRVDGVAVAARRARSSARCSRCCCSSANRVVSRERLIGELFAEQSVNSADHALRNHVSRLRKVLSAAAGDEPRLVARAPRLPAARRARRARPRALRAARRGRAARRSRPAMPLRRPRRCARPKRCGTDGRWRDLEFERFARVEVGAAGGAAAGGGRGADRRRARRSAATSRSSPSSRRSRAEHPYRERFRAQLMLALYRCGRQAEGLEVYRRTRTLLDDELGLEPGVELQQLERAILVQDPALNSPSTGARTAPSPLRDVCPFKGLAPFEPADAEFFFGRERLVDELVARLARRRCSRSSGRRAAASRRCSAPACCRRSGDECAARAPRLSGRRPSSSALLERVPPGRAARARRRPARGAVRSRRSPRTSGVRSSTRSSTPRGTRSGARSSWSRCAPTSSGTSRRTSSSPISSGRTTSCSGR